MSIHKAFFGHGTFTEFSVTNALDRFKNYQSTNASAAPPKDSIDRFIFALTDMQISSVWIQLFSRSGDVETTPSKLKLRRDLITRLGQANVAWAGWGYCAGKNWERDLKLINGFRQGLGMSAFVIDAEPEKGKDVWREKDFDQFTAAISNLFGTDNLALSTWPVLRLQDEPKNPVIKFMKIAAPRVCLFAPQAYWMNFPSKPHYKLGFKPGDYPKNDPVAYVRLVIDSWRLDGINNPLVISGQSYWGEGSPARKTMEGKVEQFVQKFADWPKIIGFNWYHGGQKSTAKVGAMSDAMIASIVRGKLGSKPYQA